MNPQRDAGARERQLAALALEALGGAPQGRALAALFDEPAAESLLAGSVPGCAFWRRRALGGAAAAPWPPDGPWDAVLLRWPKAKEEARMAIEALLARLAPGGALVVAGGNEEGARSAESMAGDLGAPWRQLLNKRRARVYRIDPPADPGALRARLEDWLVALPHPGGGGGEWASFPGLFAFGREDPGSAALAARFDFAGRTGRALDFGCGDGRLAWAAGRGAPGLRWSLVDVDALALEAAGRNLPGARLLAADGADAAVAAGPFDLVVSNPPLHRGKDEDFRTAARFVQLLPELLAPGGEARLVCLRNFPAEAMLRAGPLEVRAERAGPYALLTARETSGGS